MYNIWKVNEIYFKMLQKGARYLLKIRKICFRIDFYLKIVYTFYCNTLNILHLVDSVFPVIFINLFCSVY